MNFKYNLKNEIQNEIRALLIFEIILGLNLLRTVTIAAVMSCSHYNKLGAVGDVG